MLRTIFSLKLAQILISQGFKVVDCSLNNVNSSKIVFHFDVSEDILQEFNEFVNKHKSKEK